MLQLPTQLHYTKRGNTHTHTHTDGQTVVNNKLIKCVKHLGKKLTTLWNTNFTKLCCKKEMHMENAKMRRYGMLIFALAASKRQRDKEKATKKRI